MVGWGFFVCVFVFFLGRNDVEEEGVRKKERGGSRKEERGGGSTRGNRERSRLFSFFDREQLLSKRNAGAAPLPLHASRSISVRDVKQTCSPVTRKRRRARGQEASEWRKKEKEREQRAREKKETLLGAAAAAAAAAVCSLSLSLSRPCPRRFLPSFPRPRVDAITKTPSIAICSHQQRPASGSKLNRNAPRGLESGGCSSSLLFRSDG